MTRDWAIPVSQYWSVAMAVGAALATAGAVMSFTAAGGDLKDLTDPNKLKAAFGGDDADGGSTGGSEMPPPPPPPA